MDRAEHLQWCKDRAIEYVNRDDMPGAFASFNSDMGKHQDTSGHLALKLGAQLFFGGLLGEKTQMKDWILGFN